VRQCVHSVIDQLGPNDQIVIVEDHSTDNSLHIVEQIAESHAQILLVRPEVNGGLGQARNLGMKSSESDYVLFLDSDDYLLPGSLDAIRSRCDATDADLVMFDYARLYWNGRMVRNMLGGLLGGQPDTVVLDDVPDLLRIINIATNKAYRREFLNDNDLWFPSGYYEDVPVTYPAFCLATSISLLDRVCYAYRQRRTGSILLSTDSRHFDLLKQFDTVLSRFSNDPRLHRWLPVIWERAANHIVAVLAKGEQRLPSDMRAAFFKEASELLNRYLPNDPPIPSGDHGLKYRLIVRGDLWPSRR
jgi:CDP-glycerol glycerophosphotransferase